MTIRFGVEVNPETVNMSREGVRRINDVFSGQFLSGQHPGAQLVVLRHGQVVVDRHIGVRRLGTTQSVHADTPFVVFSCTKAMVSVTLLQLIEQGRVELDAPIAEYWPEFGVKGKDVVTVRHALTHQAGLPLAGLYWEIPRYWNWEQVTSYVASLDLEYEPGTRTAYHMVNFGYLVGEVVSRVSGLPYDHYIQKNLFDPLGMKDSFMGLPPELTERSAEIYYGHPDQRNPVLLMRQARYAVIPAGSVNTTARDLATFYQMILNEGIYDGVRLLQPHTARLMTSLQNADYDHTLNEYAHWGLGFGLGGPKPPQYQEGLPIGLGRKSNTSTFGHAGQRSSMGWADWERDVVVAFTCNQLNGRLEARIRWQMLSDAVWDAMID